MHQVEIYIVIYVCDFADQALSTTTCPRDARECGTLCCISVDICQNHPQHTFSSTQSNQSHQFIGFEAVYPSVQFTVSQTHILPLQCQKNMQLSLANYNCKFLHISSSSCREGYAAFDFPSYVQFQLK